MEYLIHLAILFAIYAILAVSLNLVVGYTGLLSVTHAAFLGIGAYTTAILTINFGLNFFVAVGIGIVCALILSWLIGWVLSRLGGDYYVLGTVGFNFIVFTVMLNWQSLTRGPLGIPGIPRPELFGLNLYSNSAFLILVALFLAGAWFASTYVVKSSFGRALKAIREDEMALRVFGYRTVLYKLAVFSIAAAMAAAAGSLFAAYITFVDPVNFSVMESVFILSIAIVGGAANLRGSLLGALILVLLPEFLRFLGFPSEIAGHMRQAVYGLLLILFMLYRPQGLIGEYKL